jgi:hypothetical protein
MGTQVKRVRRAEICAKRHLTFAFFSPRVCPGWTGPATAEVCEWIPHDLGRLAAEAIYGANKTAKGSPGLPGFV